MWISILQGWEGLEGIPVPPQSLSLFQQALTALLEEGHLTHPNLNPNPPTPPPSRACIKAHQRQIRKLAAVDGVEERIDKLSLDGYLPVYTDGLSVKEPIIGFVGGYGM